MDYARILQVLAICLPVFAVIGTGKWLNRAGWLNQEHTVFVNRMVYYFALPALIFREVARQRFAAFWNPELILCSLLAIVLIAVIYVVLGRVLGYRGSFAAAFGFGAFWANVTYMGFPLSRNAFGEEGLALAAIYNAFVMPVFVAMGFLLIALQGNASGPMRLIQRLRAALINPIVLAAIAGILTALIGEGFRDPAGVLHLPVVLDTGIRIVNGWLGLIGGMGLPLALLTIGASLHFGDLRAYARPLILVVAGKLIVLPLLTLIAMAIFAAHVSHEIRGIAVLMAATPNAVASYVVARQSGVQEGFVASMLVVGTLGSIITIPLWLYLVL